MKATARSFFIAAASLTLLIGMLSCKFPSPSITPASITPTNIIPSESTIPAPIRPLTNTPPSTPTTAPDPAQIFADSILSTITDRQADFQDDFSDPGSGWEAGRQNVDVFIGSRDFVNGQYVMIADAANAEQIQKYGFGFVSGTNRYLGKGLTDYVLEVDQNWIHGSGFTMINLFGADGYAYNIRLGRPGRMGGFWLEHPVQGPETATQFTNDILFPFTAYEKSAVQITFIVQGEQFALLADGQPLYTSTLSGEHSLTLSAIEFRLLTDSTTESIEVHWDNLKIWDLNR